jgi:hypothetical protein
MPAKGKSDRKPLDAAHVKAASFGNPVVTLKPTAVIKVNLS